MNMKKKILIIAIVLLLVGGMFSLTIKPVRNKFIDSMIPQISKTENCYYTDEDIENAIECMKENYKQKDKWVIPVRIYFSEEKSSRMLSTYYLAETTEKENIIVCYCDYIVLKDFAAYSQGLFTGCSGILVRENAETPWDYVDGGWA